ncbi:MAG: hypothetical protein KZQ83_09905 [gamma proteobacterium symbiont of Taylorina sp.]|nr:hypothetical protein [gamma proteobacterium symbiont of Taylorina sp.]
MLDFIFFHPEPMQGFQDFLESLEIPYESDTEFQASIEQEGLTISISDKYDIELIEKIECHYDKMMGLNEQLISDEEDASEIKNAGISVNLSNGQVVLADVNPNILYKLSLALEADEILELVGAIADAVENPDIRPLCKR